MIEGLQFTQDYTSHHEAHWREWLGEFIGRPCLGLEVGVFEARSSAWFLEEICTHRSARLVAIDPWAEKSAGNRLQISRDPRHGYRFEFWGSPAEWVLAARIADRKPAFDWIYLDGAKEAANVLAQSTLAWQVLRPGGVLIWDDYLWQWQEGSAGPRPEIPPGPAIDAFLSVYAPQLEVIGRGWQVAVRKT